MGGPDDDPRDGCEGGGLDAPIAKIPAGLACRSGQSPPCPDVAHAGQAVPDVLVMAARFEASLVEMRARGGFGAARTEPRARGRRPKLSAYQEVHLVELHRSGEKRPGELAELFGVGRSTVYRALDRAARAGFANRGSRLAY
jgi:hypothetical protein